VVAVSPAWNVLRSAPAQRAALESQLGQMRGLAAEARELRALPPVAPEQAQAALKAATTRLGAAAKMTVAADRVTVTLSGVDAVAFTEWLGEVRSAARARVVEAQLNRSAQAYSGNVVLSLPRPL
jgi:general secretion pathway protein M